MLIRLDMLPGRPSVRYKPSFKYVHAETLKPDTPLLMREGKE
jgi:hypothetical protein